MKRGPKPDTERDFRVLEFRLEDPPRTFRWIAEKMGEDVSNIYGRYKRAKKRVGELST